MPRLSDTTRPKRAKGNASSSSRAVTRPKTRSAANRAALAAQPVGGPSSDGPAVGSAAPPSAQPPRSRLIALAAAVGGAARRVRRSLSASRLQDAAPAGSDGADGAAPPDETGESSRKMDRSKSDPAAGEAGQSGDGTLTDDFAPSGEHGSKIPGRTDLQDVVTANLRAGSSGARDGLSSLLKRRDRKWAKAKQIASDWGVGRNSWSGA